MLTLFDWQEESLVAALPENSGSNAWAMFWEMSLGKTLVAVEYAKRVGAEQTIVVLPLNTRKGWERTVREQTDLPTYRLASDKKNIVNFLKLNAGERGVYEIGWEYMRTGVLHGASVDLVIADECHKMQNHGKSNQSIAMRSIKGTYRLALSGTPAANKPEGIFGSLAWLWPEKYTSQTRWIDEHWRVRRNGAVIDLIREIRPGSVMEDIPNVSRELRKDHRDDLPARMPEIPIEIELTPGQRKVYDQIDQDALAWVDDGEGGTDFVPTSIPLVKDLRLSQICLAVPSVIDGVVTFKENAKSSAIDSLMEVLEEIGDETLIVYTASAKIIPIVAARLRKAGIATAEWTGNTKQADRDNYIEWFGDKFRVLVASIAAIAEGTDGLQHKCHNEFWLSKHPTQYLNTQCGFRLDRPGQQEPVQSWYVYAPGTVSETRLERLDEIQFNLDDMIDYEKAEAHGFL